LPHGFIDAAKALEQLGGLHHDWPTSPLWMPAVRTRDGQRVVFGRDQHPPLGTAIGACAIPLLLRPVRIGRDHYIDGATHSPTNADLLVDAGVDAAIVIAPMSGRLDALRRRPDHTVRSAFARRLRAEARQLADAGIDVHIFEPDAATLQVLGINPIDRTRTARVVPPAFLATGSQISPSLATMLQAASHNAA
jgi:NTE family protein